MEFCGYDSLRIEKAWKQRQDTTNENGNTNCSLNTEGVVVRGGMYEVELESMKCVSIYWPGNLFTIFNTLNTLLEQLYIYIYIYIHTESKAPFSYVYFKDCRIKE
jgi:hypothetical protein